MPTSSAVLEAMIKVTGGQQAATELNAMSGAVQKTAGQMDASGKAIQAVGNQSTQTTSKLSGLGNTLKSNAGSLTAVTGSAWGLFNAFDDMEKKVLGANRAQTMASRSALMLQKAQDKLADIAAKQGKGSAEYARQLEVVNLAQQKATQTGEKAKIMAGDLQESYAQLAMTAGPMAAALGGSVAQLVGGFQKVKPAADAASKATALMGPAGMVGAGGFKAMGVAAKGFLISLGPIGWALIAIGALLTLYATNAFGFRDAVNGIAKSIMDTFMSFIPALKQVGTQILNFINTFMSAIGAGNIPTALTKIKDMIMGIFTEWVKPAFDKIYNYILSIIGNVASAFGAPIEAIKNAIGGAIDFILVLLGEFGAGFQEAFAALASGDILGAIQAIQDMFTTLSTTILDALTILFTQAIPTLLANLAKVFAAEGAKWLTVITDVIDSIVDLFTDVGKMIQTEVAKWGTLIQTEAAKWVDSIMKGLGGLGDLGSDFGKIGADIAADIAAGISLWDWGAAWKSFVDAIKSTIEFIAGGFKMLVDGISGFITGFDWAGVWNTIATAFGTVVNTIVSAAQTIASTVGGFIKNFSWTDSWNTIATAFGTVVNTVLAAAKTMGPTIVGFIKSSGLVEVWQPILVSFGNTVNEILKAAQSIGETIKGFIESVDWKSAWKTFEDASEATWDAIVSGAQKALQFFLDTKPLTEFAKALGIIGKTAEETANAEKILHAKTEDLVVKYGVLSLKSEDVKRTEAEKNAVMSDSAFKSQDLKTKVEGLIAVSAQYKSVVVEAGKALKDDLVNGLIETATKLKATNILWSAAETATQGYMTQLQQVVLSEIDVTKSLTNAAYAIYLFNEGMIKGKTAMQGMFDALEGQRGELVATNQAWADLTQAQSESLTATQLSIAANIDVTQSLTDAAFAQFTYNNGVIEGRTAVKSFLDEIVKEKGIFDATMAALTPLVEGYMGLGEASGWSAEQMKQFIGVIEGAPSAITALGNSINDLSNSTTGWVEQIKGDKETVEKVFSDWKLSDSFPVEIRALMSKAQQEFVAGKAQVTRVADTFMPAIANAFELGARSMNFAELQALGPKAAAQIESGFNGAVPPVLQRVVELLQHPPSGIKDGLPWMQQVITEFENAKNPMNAFIQEFLKAGGAIGDLAPRLAGTAEGLNQMFGAMDSVAGSGKQLNLTLAQLNKVTIEGVGTFAQVGDNLIPIGDNANAAATGLGNMTGQVNPLNSAIQLAATTLKQFNAYLADAANMPKLQIDTSAVVTNLNSVITAINGIKQTTVPVIKVDTGAVATNLNSVQLAINGLKQAKVPIVTVTTVAGHGLVKKLQAAITAMKQARAILISVNTSAATNAVNRLKSLVNAMPNIKRTITYTYRIVGSRPNPPNLNRTITYRYQTVGSRPTSIAPQSLTNNTGPMIMPMTTGGSVATTGGTGGGAAGGRPTNFQGDVYLDTYRVGRVMGKAIAENNV